MTPQNISIDKLTHSMQYLHSELAKAARRTEYISHHLKRCKQQKDKIKLAIMLAAALVYATILVQSISKTATELMNLVFLTLPKPQLSLPIGKN